MLTIEQCKQIHPELADLTEDQLKSIRDAVYAIVEHVIDDCLKNALDSEI